MNQAKLSEVAPWAGITQGANSVNFIHVVLYVKCGRQKHGLFCKTRPPVSFVMSKFQNLLKVPFHFVSQQKTRSSAKVLDVALAVRPIRNNTFEIN